MKVNKFKSENTAIIFTKKYPVTLANNIEGTAIIVDSNAVVMLIPCKTFQDAKKLIKKFS